MSEVDDEISYYGLLGLEPSASPEEIMRAYKLWALQFHPDKISDSDVNAKQAAQDMLARLNEAKEVLMDAERRRIYDALGSSGLRQLTTTDYKSTELAALLEELRKERELQHTLEIARAHGELHVALDARDTYAWATAPAGRRRALHAPEVTALAAGTEFTHRVSDATSLVMHGRVGGSANTAAAIVRPDGLYTHRPPASHVGCELRHEWRPKRETVALGFTTDGSTIDPYASVQAPLTANGATSVSAHVALSSLNGRIEPSATINHTLLAREGTSVVGSATVRFNNPARVLDLNVVARNKGKVALGCGLSFGSHFFAESGGATLAERLPTLSLSWTRLGSARVFSTLSASSGLTVGYNVTRHIDKHTYVRVGSRVGLESGFDWTVAYKRGHQEVEVPIHVADEIPPLRWLTGLFFAPLALDYFTRFVLLRPYHQRQRQRRRREIAAALQRARLDQRFMEREAADSRRRELDAHGVLILQARFGLARGIDDALQGATCDVSGNEEEPLPTWLPCHTLLQTRVQHERNHSRILIPGNFANIPGVTDAHCGDEERVLDIHYVYNGNYHHVTYEEDDIVSLPQADHKVGQGRLPDDVRFDWPLKESTAEGAGYEGVD